MVYKYLYKGNLMLKNNYFLLSILALSIGMVNAQSDEADSSESADDNVEEVVVTGSRIKRTDNLSSPTPMITLGEDQIELTGSVNVYDILNELPQAGEGTSRGNSNFTVGSSGLQTVNLRGLGAGRTLTLVNGRRWVGGVPGTGVVDLNSIPTDLISNLEVITGGASAVYGSDAVAGVVNINLKTDFEGLVVEAMDGGYNAGDGDTSLISVTFGANFADGKGNSVFNIRTDEQGRVMARDRKPYTGRDLFYYGWYYGATYGPPYDTFISDPGYSSYVPQGRFFVSGSTSNSVGMKTFDCSNRGEYSVTQSDTVVDWSAAGGSTACGFNRTHFRALEVPLDRFSVFNATNYEFDNGTKLFAEFSYTSVDSQSEFEPVPFNSEDVFGGLGTFGFNISNPYMPAAIRDAAVAAQGGVQALDANGDPILNMYVDADGNELQVPFIRRLLEFGTRGSSNTRETFRGALGANGTYSNGWDWDAYYQYGISDRMQYSQNYNAINMANALHATTDANGNPICTDVVARAQGCVPINLFGLNAASDEAVAYVKAITLRQSKNTQEVMAYNVTGPFNLMGIDASFAAGFEKRTETGADIPDSLQQAGLHGSNVTPATEGSYDVEGAYVEVLIPLVSDAFLMQDLTFEAAYRTDDYSTAGRVSASKFGLNWTVNDDLRIRTVVAESSRAPDIDELFSGQAQSYTAISDPCAGVGNPAIEPGMNPTVVANCLSDPRIASTAAAGSYDQDSGTTTPGFNYSQPDTQTISGFTGGNPNLEVEDADTTTLGFVYTPTYLEGFALSLDYYKIEIENVISSVSATRLINECYQSTDYPNVSQCSAHERFPTGKLRYWYSYGINQSFYETAGYDLAMAYTFEDLRYVPGQLKVNGIWTRRDEHVFQTTAESSPADYVGEVGYNPNIAKLNLLYTLDEWILSIQSNYYGHAQDDVFDPPGSYHLQAVDSMIYTDVQLRYQMNDNLNLYIGVDNIMNHNPPYCPTCKNEPVPGAHYTAESYARVWDSKYTYLGFRWTL